MTFDDEVVLLADPAYGGGPGVIADVLGDGRLVVSWPDGDASPHRPAELERFDVWTRRTLMTVGVAPSARTIRPDSS